MAVETFVLHTTNGALKGNLKKGAIISETTNGGVDFTVDSPTPAQPFRLDLDEWRNYAPSSKFR